MQVVNCCLDMSGEVVGEEKGAGEVRDQND